MHTNVALAKLYEAIDELTDVLLDAVPDGVTWEDGFPEVDRARSLIQEAIEEINNDLST